jgi:hypothetical protein
VPPVTITVPGPTVTRDISVCPAPTNSAPVARTKTTTRQLWGCDPGYICDLPKPQGCNLWAEAPADDFLCDPQYCKPAPYLPRVDWPENETSYYPPTPGYFNLNPNAFGLSYDIFAVQEIVTKIHGKKTTIRTGNWISQTAITHFPPEPTTSTVTSMKAYYARGSRAHLSKRDETIAPAVCFGPCNSAWLESQRVGLIPDLCDADSAFTDYTNTCLACIDSNSLDLKLTLREYVGPEFENVWGFCSIQPGETQSSSTDLPPQTQVTQLPTLSSTSQGAPNTETDPVPITTSSTADEPEQPTPSSTEPPATPSSSEEVPPATTTMEEEEPTPSETDTPPEETSASESASSPGPSSTGGGGSGGGGGGGGGDDTVTPTVTGTGTSTLRTSTTGRPATSSIATAAAGRVVVNWVGSLIAGGLGVVFFF